MISCAESSALAAFVIAMYDMTQAANEATNVMFCTLRYFLISMIRLTTYSGTHFPMTTPR